MTYATVKCVETGILVEAFDANDVRVGSRLCADFDEVGAILAVALGGATVAEAVMAVQEAVDLGLLPEEEPSEWEPDRAYAAGYRD